MDELEQAREYLKVWERMLPACEVNVRYATESLSSAISCRNYIQAEVESHRAEVERLRRESAIELVNSGNGTTEPF